jgi:hypothetical protein
LIAVHEPDVRRRASDFERLAQLGEATVIAAHSGVGVCQDDHAHAGERKRRRRRATPPVVPTPVAGFGAAERNAPLARPPRRRRDYTEVVVAYRIHRAAL